MIPSSLNARRLVSRGGAVLLRCGQGCAYSRAHSRAAAAGTRQNAASTKHRGCVNTCGNRFLLILLPVLCDVLRQRVVRVRRAQQRLDAGRRRSSAQRQGQAAGAQRVAGPANLRRTVRICSAGLHLSFRMSRQMRPSWCCVAGVSRAHATPPHATARGCSAHLVDVRVVDLGQKSHLLTGARQ